MWAGGVVCGLRLLSDIVLSSPSVKVGLKWWKTHFTDGGKINTEIYGTGDEYKPVTLALSPEDVNNQIFKLIILVWPLQAVALERIIFSLKMQVCLSCWSQRRVQ